MNILVIYLGRRGGGSLYTLFMAKALHELGNCIDVFCSQENDNLVDFSKENFRLQPFIVAHSIKQIVTRFVYLLALIGKVVTWRISNPRGVAHFTMFHLWNIPLMILLRIFGCRVIFTVHDFEPHIGDGGLFMKAAIKIQVFLSNGLVMLNTTVKEQVLASSVSRLSQSIICLPHPPFVSATTSSEPLDVDLKKPEILFIGRISQYKGIELFLEASKNLLQQNQEARFRLSGSGDLSHYTDAISLLEPNISINNDWLSDDEVLDEISAATLCILPYIDSTQSGILPTALALGVPVVITPSHGLMAQLPEGCGIVAESFTGADICSAVMEALSDKVAYCEMSRNGKEIFGTDIWTKQAETLTLFYSQKSK